MTYRVSLLACFSVPHVLITYVLVLEATLPQTPRSFLSSFNFTQQIKYKSKLADFRCEPQFQYLHMSFLHSLQGFQFLYPQHLPPVG